MTLFPKMWTRWGEMRRRGGWGPTLGSMAVREIGVVGGGIAGTTIAYELAKRGARVTLFERGSLAGEASGRNMGLLLNQIESGVVRVMQRSLGVYLQPPGARGALAPCAV